MPAGELVTWPDPTIVRVRAWANEIVKVAFPTISTVPVKLVIGGIPCNSHTTIARCVFKSQPPEPKLVIKDPGAAFTVIVTIVPLGNVALHCDPQLIPEGEEVTVPEPVIETFN